jgi:hypothetical protein
MYTPGQYSNSLSLRVWNISSLPVNTLSLLQDTQLPQALVTGRQQILDRYVHMMFVLS